MDEGQRTQASIKEKVSESGKGGFPSYLQKKKRDDMGRKTSTTHADQRKNPTVGEPE